MIEISKDLINCIVEEFENELYYTKDYEISTKKVLESKNEALEYEDDSICIWLGLSNALWKHGKLTEEIKEETLQVIKNTIKLLDPTNKKDKLYLEKQIDKLNSVNPRPKGLPKNKGLFYRCKWNTGDVYAYFYTDTDTLEQKYVYFVKMDNHYRQNGKVIIPDLYMYDLFTTELLDFKSVIENPFYNFIPAKLVEKRPWVNPYCYMVMIYARFGREVPVERLVFLGNIENFKGIDIKQSEAQYCRWTDIDFDLTRNLKWFR